DAETRMDESSPEAFEAVIEPELEAPEVAAVHEVPVEDPAQDEPAPVAAAAAAPEEPTEVSDEDITLEAIMQDLKRREGRG
ncbi:MAG TPA: hypothetical protein DIT48_01505, partial [Actinobacteria bacterium]|nr:hypothetical protein [Actinomycetota bacterium]